MPDTSLEVKQNALATLQKLEADWKALESRTMDYIVTSISSDAKNETHTTHNFYFSIAIPKPTEAAPTP